MPDHGDLWSASWDYWAGDGELFFETQGKSLPYRFQKSARLEDNAIMLAYEIENTGSEEFAFLWSAHPLLAVEASCRIVPPEEVSGLFVEWSRGERLVKFGDSCGWPIAACKDGERVDLSAPRDASARTADKVFTSRLQEGFCALSYPQTKETIAFHFNPQDVPYLGIWICQGGLAVPGGRAFHSRIGAVYRAPGLSSRGGCDVLRPKEKKKSALRIEIQSGDSIFAAR
jgi:hypothetical protein